MKSTRGTLGGQTTGNGSGSACSSHAPAIQRQLNALRQRLRLADRACTRLKCYMMLGDELPCFRDAQYEKHAVAWRKADWKRKEVRGRMKAILEKPKFGKECNGCGLCCRLQLCDVAAENFPGASAPCPALEQENGRFWCGLVRRPSYHLKTLVPADNLLIPHMLTRIPIGQGCGMEDDWEDEEEFPQMVAVKKTPQMELFKTKGSEAKA